MASHSLDCIGGPVDGRPVLALHGWLDNASSFSQLAPRLAGARVIALDLTGHGHSDHRSRDATYAIWDDIPQVLGLLDHIGWSRFSLVGHSRGAMICLLMAAIAPERVDACIVLDALTPPPLPDEDVVKQLRRFVKDGARLRNRTARLNASPEAFVDRRAELGHHRDATIQMMDRAVASVEGGYRVRADPRLHAASPVKFTASQLDAVLAAVEAPVLALWATQGLSDKDWVRNQRRRAGQIMRDYLEIEIAGHHHWHLDPATAEVMAAHVDAFLARSRKAAA